LFKYENVIFLRYDIKEFKIMLSFVMFYVSAKKVDKTRSVGMGIHCRVCSQHYFVHHLVHTATCQCSSVWSKVTWFHLYYRAHYQLRYVLRAS